MGTIADDHRGQQMPDNESKEKSNKSMLLAVIMASEAIDSSGEILDIGGCDLSDAEGEGPGILVNYEHKGSEGANNGQEIVGRVIFAKKIFSADDCDDKFQKQYWQELKLPYIYGVVRLFDAAGSDGARGLAAQIRDAHDNKEKILVRWSVEGSTLAREGNRLTSCVIRRLAATTKPCNRTCDTVLLQDPQAPAGFEKEPEAKSKDILDEILTQKFEHPAYSRLGSVDSECQIMDDETCLRAIIRAKVLVKAIAAGSYDAAPSSLTGGAALQREDAGLGHGTWKRRAFKALKDFDTKAYTHFDKSEFSAFLKHQLPDVDPEFLDKFTDLIHDYKAKLSKAQEEDPTPVATKAPKAPKVKAPKAPKVKAPKAPAEPKPLEAPAIHFEKAKPPVEPLTVRGVKMKIQPGLKDISFDEEKGIIHTPRGSVKLYNPAQDKDENARKEYDRIINDPSQTGFHDRVMEKWSRVHELARAGRVPANLMMHATIFSLLSPNTPVPVQELMYSVHQDTILVTCENKQKKIKDFVAGDRVWGVDSNGQIIATSVVALHDHGCLEGFGVEFEGGHSVTCSKNHKFLTRDGMRPLWYIVQNGLGVFCEPKTEAQWMAEPLRPDVSDGSGVQGAPEELLRMQKDSPGIQSCFGSEALPGQSGSRTGTDEVGSGRIGRVSQGTQRGVNGGDSAVGEGKTGGILCTPEKGRYCDEEMADGPSPGSAGPLHQTACCGGEMEKASSGRVQEKLHKAWGSGQCLEGDPSGRVCCNQGAFPIGRLQSGCISDGNMAPGQVPGAGPGGSDSVWGRGTQKCGFCVQGQQGLGRGRRVLAFLPRGGGASFLGGTGESAVQGPDIERGVPEARGCYADTDVHAVFLRKQDPSPEGTVGPVAYSDAPLASAGGLVLRRIIRVRAVGLKHMYDLEVSHPKHNFLLPNGIVTSNSHFVDAMRATGLDPRTDPQALGEDWLNRDNPKVLPESSRSFFENKPGIRLSKQSFKQVASGKGYKPVLDEAGNKIPNRGPGDIIGFMMARQKLGTIVQYGSYEKAFLELQKQHKADGGAFARAVIGMKQAHDRYSLRARAGRLAEGEVEPLNPLGLAQKTSRYAALMFGAGNAVVPDTHFVRNLMGMEHGVDGESIDYMKRALWATNEPATLALEGIDRWFAKNHPAVKHMQSGKWGHLFQGEDANQAVGPAFWKHWCTIVPHEAARGMKTGGFNEGTDHMPFWDATDADVEAALADLHKSESDTGAHGDPVMAHKTAMLHRKWVQQYGEIPALSMYYAYLVPHLVKEEDRADPVLKTESVLVNLSKALSDAKSAASRHGVAIGGGQKFTVLREGPDHFVAQGREGLVKLPKQSQGRDWEMKQILQHEAPAELTDAYRHGITGLTDGQEQVNLIHGLDLSTHDHSRAGWVRSGHGPIFIRCEPIEKGWSAAKNEVAFYNASRDVFDLNRYVPVAAGFNHPVHAHDVAAIAGIPGVEHFDSDSDGWVRGPHAHVLRQLGDSGELSRLGIMDTVMGVPREDWNCVFTFHGEPHLRLVDHGNLNGLTMGWPAELDKPAYMLHYGQMNGTHWAAMSVHPEARAWLATLDPERLEKSLQRSGMPKHMRDEATRRLTEMQVHHKINGSNVTMGSLLLSPWSHLEEPQEEEPNGSSEPEEEDPWTEAKYRRGGHEEFLKWLEDTKGQDLDGENKEFFSDGLAKAVSSFNDLANNKTSATGLYRAYKSSPHHPHSLLLKYIVNRLTDPVYRTGTPEQIAAHEQDWLKFHQSGKAGEKNGQVQIKDLHQALANNPKLEKNVLDHQKKLHKFIRTLAPHRIVRVGGEEYVPLARGINSDKQGREHSISSWTDIPDRAREFGSHVLQHLVPLKNIWYSYDVGPKAATSKAVGNEDEFLVSPGGQLEKQPGTEVSRVVPRRRHNVSTNSITQTDLIHAGHPGVSGKDLDQLLIGTVPNQENYQNLKAALEHPNTTPETLGHVISHTEDTTPHGAHVRGAAAKNPRAPAESVSQALSSPNPTVRYSAIQNPNATPGHIAQGLLDELHMVREKAAGHPNATSGLVDMALEDPNVTVRGIAASHKNASPESIHKALSDPREHVRVSAMKNPNATPAHLERGLEDRDAEVRVSAIRHPNASFRNLRDAIGHHDENVRALAAQHPSMNPQLINTALSDPLAGVRRFAASHPNASTDNLDRALLDPNPGVREAASKHPRTTPEMKEQALKAISWEASNRAKGNN